MPPSPAKVFPGFPQVSKSRTRSVPPVVRIGRRTIRTDRRVRAVRMIKGVMTVRTERAERAKPELDVVAAMALDVIGDCRRHHVPKLQAGPAQRLDVQLMPAAALPASSRVPAVNFGAAWHQDPLSSFRMHPALALPAFFERARLASIPPNATQADVVPVSFVNRAAASGLKPNRRDESGASDILAEFDHFLYRWLHAPIPIPDHRHHVSRKTC